MKAIATHFEAFVGQPVHLMARVLGLTGQTVGTTHLTTSIQVFAWDIANGTTAPLYSSTVVQTSTAITDSLHTSARWLAAGGDEQGCQFDFTLSSTVFARPSNHVRAEVVLTPIEGSSYNLPVVFTGKIHDPDGP